MVEERRDNHARHEPSVDASGTQFEGADASLRETRSTVPLTFESLQSELSARRKRVADLICDNSDITEK